MRSTHILFKTVLFLEEVQLQCFTCGHVVGTVGSGDYLPFMQDLKSGRMFALVAAKSDWIKCRRCYSTPPIPMVIQEDMLPGFVKEVEGFMYMRDPTIEEFRQEFPATPLLERIIRTPLLV